MSEKYVKIYELYLDALSAIPDARRKEHLRESLAENIVFANPQRTRRGIADVAEHLEGFQLRSPGGSFRMNNMVGWDIQALAEWQFIDANGEAGFSGYDVLTFDEQGLVSTILLFGNVEAQKLAWRHRDPVKLALTK
jgi:SnoaL-like domain